MWELAVPVSIGVAVILVIGLMLAKLYRRSTRDEAYVRTGLGGQKVVLDGGFGPPFAGRWSKAIMPSRCHTPKS